MQTILRRWLEADRDGELHGWRRRWLRRALERSPELRADREVLYALREAIRDAEASDTLDVVGQGPSPSSLWSRLEADLDRIDRERGASDSLGIDREAGVETASGAWTLRDWIPAGAMAGVAAAALAAMVWWSGVEDLPQSGATAHGHLRTLDTGGHPVWVQESEGATIIWLVGNGAEIDEV